MFGPYTVRSVLCYEYARLIVQSIYAFKPTDDQFYPKDEKFWMLVRKKQLQLMSGELKPSSILKENKMLVASDHVCEYCGQTGEIGKILEWEHLIPRSKGGPDSMDNLVLACRPCNLRKGAKDPANFYHKRRFLIPRVVAGKFLKLLFAAHEAAGTLDCPVGFGDDNPIYQLSRIFQEPNLRIFGTPTDANHDQLSLFESEDE